MSELEKHCFPSKDVCNVAKVVSMSNITDASSSNFGVICQMVVQPGSFDNSVGLDKSIKQT